MSDTLNWDEFRIVRAIAETQSLYGAAERLGLTHSTMFRRLAALETRLGFKLFERERASYRPTAAGEDMVALATVMGDTIAEFERRVGAQDLQPTGQVRLSTEDAIGALVMPKVLADFRAAYPGLQVEMATAETPLNLFDGEADVVLRAMRCPLSPELTGQRLAPSRWGVYVSSSLIPPGEEARLSAAPWVALSASAGPQQAHRWLARNIDPSRVVARVGSATVLAELAARGVGAALLPCLIGATKRELRRIGDADGEADGDVWLAAAPQALHKARVRALYEFLAQEIGRRRAWFAGETTVED